MGVAVLNFNLNREDFDSLSGPDELSTGANGCQSSSACVHCKSLKVRCDFTPGEKVCQRCQLGNIRCVPRTRKKRKPAPTHEDLQERAQNQDRQIEAILRQLDKLRASHKVKDLLAKVPLEHSGFTNIKISSEIEPSAIESASLSYFGSASPEIEHTCPDIVKYCDLYPEDILDLFSIFFERINPYFSILDPELHTVFNLIWRAPFLFTVICVTASRYYEGRSGLFDMAKDFARDAASRALIDGSKSLDVCQAYLLMAVYPVPKKKWAEDKSWLLMGVAIRMALELGLHQPPPPDCSEREALNRMRTWLNCYCVDGSHAIQFGKMPMLRLDDYLARNSRTWYKSSGLNLPFDVHLCGYVQIILLMADWRRYVGEGDLRQRIVDGLDITGAALEKQRQLDEEMDVWKVNYFEDLNLHPLPICLYRGNTTQLITAYLRLVVLSLSFQHLALDGFHSHSMALTVLNTSMDAANTVIQIMLERLYPTGYLRYAMAANFLYVSFAAAFLINLLRPNFRSLLDEERQHSIIATVRRLIDVLGSKDVAVDDRHMPALYSRFLSSLLKRYTDDEDRIEDSEDTYDNLPDSNTPQFPAASWPDVFNPGYTSLAESSYLSGQEGTADMDFSLAHFLKTVSENPTPIVNTTTPAIYDPSGMQWGSQAEAEWNSCSQDFWRQFAGQSRAY
ncbi:hypothetical protein BDN72DRAFT_831085 [Pluteus cervinus]|uniref:Uncharacterized protein n=1 Tax=Pluteus cervinus TaxID=181527 RepID=A0ACD3BF15_9AGAR|nr:hypothetical protein BDN72DRAFT_831085 [Pluteus cervinus]